MNIPFYHRVHGKNETEYMNGCLSQELATDGFFMEKLLEASSVLYPGCLLLFTTSCTQALNTAVACIGLRPGDEVLIPSYNFPSAANAVLLHGGIPVLCDISPDTQNLDTADAAGRITPRTRAIVAVHYAGVSCPMDRLLALASEAGLALIEDAAQGIGAFYNGKPLGSLSDFGAVSFHHTKNLTCGEGGLMLTGNKEAYEQARQYRLHGTDRARFLNGETDRYTWNIPGSCTALSEPGAALLLSQLEALDTVTNRRLKLLTSYMERLKPLEQQGYLTLMKIPSYAKPNGHIFYIRLHSAAHCSGLKAYLAKHGIDSRTHYVPLHLSPMGERLGCRPEDLPQSWHCYETLLRLPIHTGMTEQDVDFVAEKITDYFKEGV